MIDQLLRPALEHPKKHYGVIILTLLTGLVVVWPASDEYKAAKKRMSDAREQLEEAERTIATLPQYKQLHERKVAEVSVLEKRVVSQQAAKELRDWLIQLGRETGCTVRKSNLGDASTRPWKEEDHPLNGTRRHDSGGDTPFQLETRQVSLLVTGPMAGLYSFLEEIHQVDKLIHSQAVTIKSSNDDGTAASMGMNLKLFDLTRKHSDS